MTDYSPEFALSDRPDPIQALRSRMDAARSAYEQALLKYSKTKDPADRDDAILAGIKADDAAAAYSNRTGLL
jgi:hypothetical protein